jgi:Flp pilus assembly protein TadB
VEQEDRPSGSPEQAPRSRNVVVAAAVWVVVSVLAFLFLDPILAAFVAIFGLTLVVVAYLARDWDQHSTFEERELARARKRAAKWERTKDVRARDRARWEAHQARQAAKRGED